MLTATAEMVPFPNEDTPLFPLSGCPARSCHYIFSLFSWCLQCSGTCQWLCLSSPGLCQHLHLKYLHTSQLLIVLLTLLSFLVHKYQGFTELCACFPVALYKAAILCNRVFLNREPPISFLLSLQFLFPPTAVLELPPSLLCFSAIFSSCHFST